MSVATSIPTLFLGIYILFRFSNILIKFFGYSLLVLAIGAIIIHGTYLKVGEFLDFLGLLTLIQWFFCYAVFSKDVRKFVSSFILLHLFSIVFLVFYIHLKYHLIFLSVFISFYALFKHRVLVKYNMSYKYFFSSIAFFSLGFVLFVLDLNHMICNLPVYFQGHIIWHSLSFVATFLLYKVVVSNLNHLISNKPLSYDV